MNRNFLRLISLFLALGTTVYLSACGDESSSKAPEITSFTPTSGAPEQLVTLTGKNFSTSATDNFVVFNGSGEGTVTAVTSTSLTVKAPFDVTTGKIRVTVNGKTGVSTEDFTVLAPSITSFTPLQGSIGTTITIAGMNFSLVKSENLVTVNGIAANVATASATQLTIAVPDGATTGKIEVTFAGRTATSTDNFEVL
jgi:hypothetical protein